MAQEWHYAKDGERHGPISAEELKQLATAGDLLPTDLVWTEGRDEWEPASVVKGLFRDTPPVKPPPPVPAQSVVDGSEAPALWNPKVLRLWSLLFTWGFGAFLLSRNWRAIGDETRATKAMYWCYSAIGFLVLAFLIPDSSSINSAFRTIGLGVLAAWSLLQAQPQITYLKEHFDDNYQRQPWGKPLGIAAVCLAIPILGLLSSTVTSDEIQIVKSGEFAQHPGLPVGEVVDNFLENEKWSSTADEDGNHFVIVAGEMSYDGDPAIVLLTFQLDGESFTLHSVDLDGQPQDDAFADQLFAVMYREYAESNASVDDATSQSSSLVAHSDDVETPSREEMIQLAALPALMVAIDYETAAEIPTQEGQMKHVIEHFGNTTPEKIHALFLQAARALGAANNDHSKFLLTYEPDRQEQILNGRETVILRYGSGSVFNFVYAEDRRVYALLSAKIGDKEFNILGGIKGFEDN